MDIELVTNLLTQRRWSQRKQVFLLATSKRLQAPAPELSAYASGMQG